MKIRKFNENTEKSYYIFSINDDYMYEKDFESDIYLFDNEKAAFNFLVNRIYNKCKKRFDNLDYMDNLINDSENDINSLYDNYKELISEHQYFDNLTLTYIPISSKFELDDWIKQRLEVKKYNL